MAEIRFDYECWPPIGNIEVIANEDGSGVLIIHKDTDNEVQFEDLRSSDQATIRAKIRDWVTHHRVMRENPNFGAEYGFNGEYVRGLNKDMGK